MAFTKARLLRRHQRSQFDRKSKKGKNIAPTTSVPASKPEIQTLSGRKGPARLDPTGKDPKLAFKNFLHWRAPQTTGSPANRAFC